MYYMFLCFMCIYIYIYTDIRENRGKRSRIKVTLSHLSLDIASIHSV